MRRTDLQSGVAQALRSLGHPSAGQRVVVGLSGGADSVALLDVMVALARHRGFTVVEDGRVALSAHSAYQLESEAPAERIEPGAAFVTFVRQGGVPVKQLRGEKARFLWEDRHPYTGSVNPGPAALLGAKSG